MNKPISIALLTMCALSGCVPENNRGRTMEAASPFRGYTMVEVCDVYTGRKNPVPELQARQEDFTQQNVLRHLRERPFNSRNSCEEVYAADAQERNRFQPNSTASENRRPPNQGGTSATSESRARDACTRRARLASSNSAQMNINRNRTSYSYCREDYFGNYRCTNGPEITGGAWEGIYTAQRNRRNAQEIFNTEYEICMLELGF